MQLLNHLHCRFEVPFNIWCNQCGEHIAKGVRFNAEKKQVRPHFTPFCRRLAPAVFGTCNPFRCLFLQKWLQVGSYHSTKIWAFTMRHHCGCKITIQTDPKTAEYLVTDGARRKIEQYDADDAQTLELPDANERAAIAADPLASLERKTIHAQQAAEGRQQLQVLAVQSNDRNQDPYNLNKQLRAAMRARKKVDAQLDSRSAAVDSLGRQGMAP